MAQMNTRSRLPAFTLVELLVVIAIIMALAALLMPALTAARERGKRAVCLMNQRQIYVATVAYTADYDNYLPPGSDLASGAVSAAPNGYWGNWGKFWHNYLGMTLNGNNFAKPKGVLWCPSGARQFSTAPYGWPSAIDYGLYGCALVVNGSTPAFPVKATPWWEAGRVGMRVFSMDIAHSAPGDEYYTWGDLQFSPHQAKDGIADGLNVVITDGSGSWQGRTNCTLFGGTAAGGQWQYFDEWNWMILPTKYQVLFGEWNYTLCWGALSSGANIYSAVNGRPGPSYNSKFLGMEVQCGVLSGWPANCVRCP